MTALGVLFVALKLIGVIAWPWGWVVAPFIVQAILYGIAVILEGR